MSRCRPVRHGRVLARHAAGRRRPRWAQAPAAAQARRHDPVVAKVDGQPIHLSDLKDAAQALPENVRGMPPQTLYPMLLDQLIDGRALAAEARKPGWTTTRPVQRQVAAARGPRVADRRAQQARSARRSPMRRSRPATTRSSPASPARKRCTPGISWWTTRTRRRRSSLELKGGADFADMAKDSQQGSRRRSAGRRSGFLQAGRDGARVRRRRLRHAAGRGLAGAGAQPVRLARHQGDRAPPAPSRRTMTRRATNCARR